MSHKTVAIFYNLQARETSFLLEIESYLAQKALSIKRFFIQDEEELISSYYVSYNYAIAVGGDGTTLRASLAVCQKQIPLLAINAGTVGFLTGHTRENWQARVDSYLMGKLDIEHRALIEAQVYHREKGVVHKELAVNEIAIASICRKLMLIEFQLDQGSWTRVRAEGLALATPAGSTGFTLSLGGPIIDPAVPALFLMAIAPFDLSARGIVLSERQTVRMKVHEENYFILIADGRSLKVEAKEIEYIEMSLSTQRVLWAKDHQCGGTSFYHALQQKLGWYTLEPGSE
nr:NAD(+)/NADH kinase [Entomospira nematocera]